MAYANNADSDQESALFAIPPSILCTKYRKLKIYITKTYLYNFDPLKPHFYIVKLGFTGVYFICLFSQKHRLWVLVRTASACFYIMKTCLFKYIENLTSKN